MIRGISFEVPNKRFPIIYLITKNIDIKKYYWFLVKGDVYKNNESFFDKDKYSGNELEKIINNENCYVVFLNLQAYKYMEDFMTINNYNEFLKSKCELIIFFNDSSYVDVYTKDIEIIETIKNNAEYNKFKNIKYITKENDPRPGVKDFSY